MRQLGAAAPVKIIELCAYGHGHQTRKINNFLKIHVTVRVKKKNLRKGYEITINKGMFPHSYAVDYLTGNIPRMRYGFYKYFSK